MSSYRCPRKRRIQPLLRHPAAALVADRLDDHPPRDVPVFSTGKATLHSAAKLDANRVR